MRFAFFVARRYLCARKGHAFISVISLISVLGVAIGVASLIVVMGVMNGFTTDLRDKIIGVTSHAVVFSVGDLEEDKDMLEVMAKAPGVTGVTPFIYSEMMLSSPNGVKGVVLRGIDPDSAPNVLGALRKLTDGSVEDLKDASGLPGIIVGKDMANRLRLFVGSRVNLLAPSGQQSTAGFNPRIKSFRVVGIFSIGLFEYDSSLVFVNLQAARELINWPEKRLSGIEVAVDDVYNADVIVSRVVKETAPDRLYARTWMSMNSNLFAALKLEKAAMAVILVLVVLVGSFSIVTALVMLVMEKTRDIAVLMSMGATRRAVRRIFMLQGVIIGAVGTGLGTALGLGIAWLLQRYQFIEIPKGVYSLDYLPVLLHTEDIVLTIVCAMLLCFSATLYPSARAAALEPVEALRHE